MMMYVTVPDPLEDERRKHAELVQEASHYGLALNDKNQLVGGSEDAKLAFVNAQRIKAGMPPLSQLVSEPRRAGGEDGAAKEASP